PREGLVLAHKLVGFARVRKPFNAVGLIGLDDLARGTHGWSRFSTVRQTSAATSTGARPASISAQRFGAAAAISRNALRNRSWNSESNRSKRFSAPLLRISARFNPTPGSRSSMSVRSGANEPNAA